MASVQDQCVQRGRGHDQEADAFLHTTVMTSLAYREVIRWNWKGKISELGRHLTVKNAWKINRWKRELRDMNDNVVAEV